MFECPKGRRIELICFLGCGCQRFGGWGLWLLELMAMFMGPINIKGSLFTLSTQIKGLLEQILFIKGWMCYTCCIYFTEVQVCIIQAYMEFYQIDVLYLAILTVVTKFLSLYIFHGLSTMQFLRFTRGDQGVGIRGWDKNFLKLHLDLQQEGCVDPIP